MGLDSIELLIEVEKAFDISIPDEEAEKIINVGDLHNTVLKHLNQKETDKCKSQSLYYNLRKNLSESYNIPKQNILPNFSLNNIFPVKKRRKVYSDYAIENNLILPSLTLNKPWRIFLTFIGISTILGGLALSVILKSYYDYPIWIYIIPIIGIIITIYLSKILEPLRRTIHPDSLRNFTREVLTLNYSRLYKNQEVNRKEIETIINNIISDKIGLSLEEISPEKKFHDDLGID